MKKLPRDANIRRTHARVNQHHYLYHRSVEQRQHVQHTKSVLFKHSKLFKMFNGKKRTGQIYKSTKSAQIRKNNHGNTMRYSVPLEIHTALDKRINDVFQSIPSPMIVYSDLYFKLNKSMNGVLKNVRDFTQLENNSLACGYYFDEQDYCQIQTSLQKPHLSLYELRKTVEYNAVLRNLYIQYDFDVNIASFRAKCFEKRERNNRSFNNYAPIIAVNSIEAYEQYFETKNFADMAKRFSHFNIQIKRKKFGKIWASNNDLDKITPVKIKHQRKDNNLECSDFNLSSLSVHELEEMLLSRKEQNKLKIRSLEDLRLPRNFPILEPLLLKEEDELDSEKIRLRISEHKKIVRITIAYTLAFFILAIITFYIIYYA